MTTVLNIQQQHDLVEQNLPLVRSISRKRAFGDKDMEEEFFAWASCKLVKLVPKCTNIRTFPSYVRMVVDGGILDYLRKMAKHPTVPFDDTASNKPHSFFWDEITHGLKPNWREAMILYYQEGHTLEEVGKFLGCSKSRVGKILKEVRYYLKDQWDEEDLRNLCPN